MYLHQRNFDAATECYRRVIQDCDSLLQADARCCLANVAVVRGNFERALRLADDGLLQTQNTLHGPILGVFEAMFYNQKANILALLGRCPEALQERSRAIAAVHQDDSAALEYPYVYLTANAGFRGRDPHHPKS